MLYYDRIHISEGIDVNKTSARWECNIRHYWYSLNYSFKFLLNVSNRHYDLLMMSVNLSDIAILYIKDSDYPCIFSFISKNEAIDLLQNGDLTENVEHYNKSKIIKKVKFWNHIYHLKKQL